jgi:hypothetical protein
VLTGPGGLAVQDSSPNLNHVSMTNGRSRSLRVLSHLKSMVVPDVRKTRRIKFGLLAGSTMALNLRHHTQLIIGLYEREVHDALHRLSLDVACAVDVGAAEGMYTLYFALRTPASVILSFEPDIESRDLLKDNLRINSVPLGERVILFDRQVGANDRRGMCSLDSVIEGCPRPCVVKVDVEGEELEVLRGAQQLLRSDGVSWLIETHSQDLEMRCIETLRGQAYETQVITNAWWRVVLPETRPIPHNRWLVAWRPGIRSGASMWPRH